jgi:uncharacterized membrane protein YqiK
MYERVLSQLLRTILSQCQSLEGLQSTKHTCEAAVGHEIGETHLDSRFKNYEY